MLIRASGAVINPNVIISAARGETPGEPQSHPCYLDGKYHQSTTATRSIHTGKQTTTTNNNAFTFQIRIFSYTTCISSSSTNQTSKQGPHCRSGGGFSSFSSSLAVIHIIHNIIILHLHSVDHNKMCSVCRNSIVIYSIIIILRIIRTFLSLSRLLQDYVSFPEKL